MLVSEGEGGKRDIYTVGFQLDRNPSHSPVWSIRPTLPAPTPINAHPNFIQPRTMSLHEPQFRFVLNIRLAQHQPWMPLRRRMRILAFTGQLEQPHKLARSAVLFLLFRRDRRPADDGRQFGENSCENARG